MESDRVSSDCTKMMQLGCLTIKEVGYLHTERLQLSSLDRVHGLGSSDRAEGPAGAAEALASYWSDHPLRPPKTTAFRVERE